MRISFSVRTAAERDYPAIARIQQRVPEAAQWPVGDYSQFSVLIALDDGAAADSKVAAFCAWRQTAPDEAELLNLAVDPAYRRQGAASALLEELARVTRGAIFLEVAEPNENAIALYRKAGFEAIDIRKGYYSGGKINAVVMKKSS